MTSFTELWDMKKQIRTNKCKLPTGSNAAQLGQTANSRLKMMQPRTTGPYHKSFQTFLFFSLPKLLAWGKRYILAFKLHSFSAGAVFLSPPLLGVQPYGSQDAVDEDGHDGGTDQARDGHSHKPRHEDVSEQTPVYCLPWAQPSYCNHRAHLETQQSSDKSHQLP